jgi:cellulose synthase (UDP-forming)
MSTNMPFARLEMSLTGIGIGVTLIATSVVAGTTGQVLCAHLAAGRWSRAVEPVVFFFLVAALVYGSIVYQLARVGYFRRLQRHLPTSETELRVFRSSSTLPSLSVLVPSYKEASAVVRKTLLSAVLLDYPNLRVVLLIDDPPTAATTEDYRTLLATRALVDEISALLETPRRALLDALHGFERRRARSEFDARLEAAMLCEAYTTAGNWFRERAADYPITDHTDRFFVAVTLSGPAACYRARVEQLSDASTTLTPDDALAEYRGLVGRFTASLTSFERKQYVNLSHEPNKAMNLNSYLGLMGGSFREEYVPAGLRLAAATDAGPRVKHVPDSDYIMVLDADSIVHPAYATRLVHFMEQPDHHRVAVVQTPYSAFPAAPEPLERVAGATTDIQHFTHQGFTFYGATFWVGANAIVRKRALDSIAQRRVERGYEVSVFIEDRTVIEDTESSLDLAAAGWRLHNYPERLAYSATPADFGALLIQRRRWANGGLIIVPKLLRQLAYGWRRLDRLVEAFFRLHYLTSLTLASVGVLVMLGVSFDRQLMSVWVPIAAAPYYILYARDLVRAGYTVRDLLRVYSLNLMLLPVHLGGVLESVQQICSGRKSPFGRTPKIEGRTAVSPAYIVAQYGLLGSWLLGAVRECIEGRALNAALAVTNGVFLYYAVHAFMKHRNARDDFWAWLRGISIDASGKAALGNAVGRLIRSNRRQVRHHSV